MHRLQIQLFFCEGSGSSISGQSGTGAMERSVTAAAGEWVDIAGDVAVAVPTGTVCWVVRLLLLYLGDRPTSDCFPVAVWLAMLPAPLTSLAGEEATAFPCRMGKAWIVRIGTCEGSDTYKLILNFVNSSALTNCN